MTTNPAVKISVCIASVRTQTLAAAVRSVCRQTFQEWELVVVGQGDKGAEQRVIEEAAPGDPRVRLIHLTERGISRARNAGLAATQGEIFAVIDDDCEAQDNWLSVLWEAFAQYPHVGLVGGALLAPAAPHALFKACPTNITAEAVYIPGQEPPLDADWVGANFAVRRSAAQQVGLFDEQMGAGAAFPAAEDTDYKLRLEKLGVAMLCTPRAVVYHTYGYRVGLKAALSFQQAYATGNGAMAAKLTLQNDPRGADWLRITREECVGQTLRSGRLHRLLPNLRWLRFYEAAYNRCLQNYVFDAEDGVLVPRAAA